MGTKAHGLANDGFLVARPNEEGASLLDRARSVQVLGQVMKQRIKKTGKKIKLKDLPAAWALRSFDPKKYILVFLEQVASNNKNGEDCFRPQRDGKRRSTRSAYTFNFQPLRKRSKVGILRPLTLRSVPWPEGRTLKSWALS